MATHLKRFIERLDKALHPKPVPIPLLVIVTPGVALLLVSARMMEARRELPPGGEIAPILCASLIAYHWVGVAKRVVRGAKGSQPS
jgi:hypothetical protein